MKIKNSPVLLPFRWNTTDLVRLLLLSGILLLFNLFCPGQARAQNPSFSKPDFVASTTSGFLLNTHLLRSLASQKELLNDFKTSANSFSLIDVN